MLHYANNDIVFQEFPDEVTLAVNVSGCPCRCPGCHSKYLWDEVGECLTEEALLAMVDHYGTTITCVGLMGGDAHPLEVLRLLSMVRRERPHLRTGWYSGRQELPEGFEDFPAPDYVKLGPWRAERGPLSAPTTNQQMLRFYADGRREDITARFWVKGIKVES